MKIYISGKISGLERQEAVEKFETGSVLAIKQISKITDEPLETYNPVRDGVLPYNACWLFHMVYDVFALIARCDAIYLLTDWRYSKGARIERRAAWLTGKKIFFE